MNEWPATSQVELPAAPLVGLAVSKVKHRFPMRLQQRTERYSLNELHTIFFEPHKTLKNSNINRYTMDKCVMYIFILVDDNMTVLERNFTYTNPTCMKNYKSLIIAIQYEATYQCDH